jgi:nitrogen fixation protein FixH
MGPNGFEVTVKGPDGKPVTDADVTVLFVMPAMPSMRMPEMRSVINLKHQKDGRYVGSGQVTMAGKWDVTVTARRAGKEIASRQIPVTAR